MNTPMSNPDDLYVVRADHDGIATLTLNRATQFNALSQAMISALQTELDALLAAVAPTESSASVELPSTCDGPGAALAHALGAQWNPDWLTDFPLTPLESPLAVRLRAQDLAPRSLPPELQARWERWRDAQRDGG